MIIVEDYEAIRRRLQRFAKKSRMYIIFHEIVNNWRTKRQLNAGKIEGTSGTAHACKTLQESLDYINRVFEDYLVYSGISVNMLQGKRILEIGPGDNLGVALKFLLAGAAQVVCLDKFFPKRDWEQQRKIYQAMREQLPDYERQIFDEVINLESDIVTDSGKLHSIFGVGIEEAEKIFDPESFDLIVSRAVIEEVYDPDPAFSAMKRLLTHGGSMIHKIDLRDYGMFSGYGHHPLTFLTVPNLAYKLMVRDSAKPNRRLINYYRSKATELGLDTKILITHIVGVGSDIIPHKETVSLGVDYDVSTLSLIRSIRPSLQPEFREMPDEELLVSGIFLIARKL